MAFHSKDGLYFERREDGSVRVSHWLHGVAGFVRADQVPVDVFVRDWTLDASTWASVVASVCDEGENGETFATALKFHGEAQGARTS